MIDAICLAAVLQFHGDMHVPLRTVPAIVITDDLKHTGFSITYPDGHGVVFLKPSADCGVLAHEFYHHAQAEHAGPATSLVGWRNREEEAHQWEQRFRMR